MTRNRTRTATGSESHRGINSKVYWYAGVVLDLIHMPIVLVAVVVGALWFPGSLYISIVAAVVILQVALLACPVMALTGWLKQRHVPDYQNHWSFTYWLYQRYGPAVAVPVFAIFLAAGIAVRQIL
jgi:hypothetical protein